jgi:hypothetical protein
LKEIEMKRKELAYVAVGVALGAAGCSPAMKSLAVPAANAEEGTAVIPSRLAFGNTPHLEEAVITLISGTTRDASSAIFRLLPKSGWSVSSDNPQLQVSIENGHVAILEAPQNEKVMFIARATISHTSGMQFVVRCHVEETCTN